MAQKKKKKKQKRTPAPTGSSFRERQIRIQRIVFIAFAGILILSMVLALVAK